MKSKLKEIYQSALFEETNQNKADLQYLEVQTASQVARQIKKGIRLIGLTRGQFSLIDLIYSILKNIDGGHVKVCTWSAGIKDANTVKWMVDSNLLKSFLLITDHSYVTRQPKYALSITELFGKENIRTSEVHAKFVLIENEEYKICIRTSMNLNANRTCESFEIDENEEIFNFYNNFILENFKHQSKGFNASSEKVNKALDLVFNNLKDQFKWQSNE